LAISKADETTGKGNYVGVDGYEIIYELKEKMQSNYNKPHIEIWLNAYCIKYSDKSIGWMELTHANLSWNNYAELVELKKQKEKKEFEQKKDSGKLKGL